MYLLFALWCEFIVIVIEFQSVFICLSKTADAAIVHNFTKKVLNKTEKFSYKMCYNACVSIICGPFSTQTAAVEPQTYSKKANGHYIRQGLSSTSPPTPTPTPSFVR
jgi:hypothetical protein